MNRDQLTVTALWQRGARLYPRHTITDITADGSDAITYVELEARVHRLGHALKRLNVGRGDRVATLAWNHRRHLELYLGVPSSGAVLHTLNLRLDARQIAEIMTHADDHVLFVDPSLVPLAAEAVALTAAPIQNVVVIANELPEGTPEGWLCYDDLLNASGDGAFDFPEDLDEREPAATSYSSATTGRPKGVVYSHRAIHLHTLALTMSDTWAISEADTVLPIVPMFHVNAWGIPYAAVLMGSRLVLPGARPTAALLADAFQRHGVTFSAAVPTVWADVFAEIERSDSSLRGARMLVSGGAPLPGRLLDHADRLGAPLVHSYGMTEASPLVLVGHQKSDLNDSHGPAERSRRLRQGLPVPGVQIKSVDTQGVPVPWDGVTPGELWLRGPWVAEEYQQDARTAEHFSDGWYRSGDIVTIDEEGYVGIVDRVSDLIKSGGEWISSVDLENALTELDGVSAACVVAIPHPRWTERPVAVVVVGPGVTDNDLDDHLTKHFPTWWLPDSYVRTEAIPLTTVGKIDKRRVRAELPAGLSDGSALESKPK